MNKILGDFISSSNEVIILSTCREEVDYRQNKSIVSYSKEIGRNYINNVITNSRTLKPLPLDHICWESISALISEAFNNCRDKICKILRESNDIRTEETDIAVIEGWNGNYFVGELNGEMLPCDLSVIEEGEFVKFFNPPASYDLSSEFFSYKKLVIIDEYEYMREFGEIEASINNIYNICNTLYNLSK